VRCPHPVYWKSTVSRPEDHIDFSERDEFARLQYLPRFFRPILELIGWVDIPTSRMLRVPTFDGSTTIEDSNKKVLRLAAVLMATIFGGIHCMAWFFTFPTHQEQVLWQISAIAITCTPWICLSLYLDSLVRRFSDSSRRVMWGVYGLICSTFVVLYITTRTVLLVLMFTTLRNLPPDAYKAMLWTSLVPHL